MGVTIAAGAEPVQGYRLIERLGRGGSGEVWKAEGPGGFRVALKVVSLLGGVGPGELRSLDVIREIRHPHLLATFGSWQVDDSLIIAMELADRTLLDRHREAGQRGEPGIPLLELLEYFRDAARGLDYLNEPRHPTGGHEAQGIQHRDIKPQNLLLLGGCVKVADFGLARVLLHSQASHTGSMTPAYAAPEFFDGRVTSTSDQYSLAVSYCHLRGGRLPFAGSISEIISGHLLKPPDLSMVPEPEHPALARALAKSPPARWPSCRAFVDALQAAARQDPMASSLPETPTLPQTTWPPAPPDPHPLETTQTLEPSGSPVAVPPPADPRRGGDGIAPADSPPSEPSPLRDASTLPFPDRAADDAPARESGPMAPAAIQDHPAPGWDDWEGEPEGEDLEPDETGHPRGFARSLLLVSSVLLLVVSVARFVQDFAVGGAAGPTPPASGAWHPLIREWLSMSWRAALVVCLLSVALICLQKLLRFVLAPAERP